ncbi:hypothetical protein WIW50_03575 [Flavobacteriaceae bacterium 3-367]
MKTYLNLRNTTKKAVGIDPKAGADSNKFLFRSYLQNPGGYQLC